jgi:glycosyltransferase involved in cell wall biosynthesis
MRIAIVCGEAPGDLNVFRQVSERMAEALRAVGHDVTVLEQPDTLAGHDVVLLQYNPFVYGRRGFAPSLVRRLWKLRLTRRRPQIVLYVHEPFVPMRNWRWVLMGLWQRAQLLALRMSADVSLVTIQRWSELLRGWPPWHTTVHLGNGSSLPARAQRDAGDCERLVVATLAAGNPHRRDDLVQRALDALASAGIAVELVVLGAGAPPASGLPRGIAVRRPGALDNDALAAELARVDVFLAPFADGVSTRRTSLMAALQHGLAVVGTDGRLTDNVLRSAGDAIRLVPVDDADGFATATLRLAEQPAERAALGAAAARLYEAEFDWPVLARRLLDVLA